MPNISVIVPVYKVENYIHRCVDSILNQTYQDFELILVDDGSPDNCGVICDEYANMDSRVVVIHQENGGLSAARNAGIDWAFANSNSQWLSFIDSDDWVHPEYLERLLSAATANNAKISVCKICSAYKFQGDFEHLGSVATEQLQTEEFFCLPGADIPILSACTRLYRKNLFQDIRYPLGKYCEDLHTTHKLLFACQEVVLVNAVMYFYFQNPDSLMHRDWSPWKLDEVAGYDELLSYLAKRNYKKAQSKVISRYLSAVHMQCTILAQQNKKEYRHYLHFMRRKFAFLSIRYWRIVRTDFSNYVWMYETFIPRTMKIYWYIVAAKKKIYNFLH